MPTLMGRPKMQYRDLNHQVFRRARCPMLGTYEAEKENDAAAVMMTSRYRFAIPTVRGLSKVVQCP